MHNIILDQFTIPIALYGAGAIWVAYIMCGPDVAKLDREYSNIPSWMKTGTTFVFIIAWPVLLIYAMYLLIKERA